MPLTLACMCMRTVHRPEYAQLFSASACGSFDHRPSAHVTAAGLIGLRNSMDGTHRSAPVLAERSRWWAFLLKAFSLVPQEVEFDGPYNVEQSQLSRDVEDLLFRNMQTGRALYTQHLKQVSFSWLPAQSCRLRRRYAGTSELGNLTCRPHTMLQRA